MGESVNGKPLLSKSRTVGSIPTSPAIVHEHPAWYTVFMRGYNPQHPVLRANNTFAQKI